MRHKPQVALSKPLILSKDIVVKLFFLAVAALALLFGNLSHAEDFKVKETDWVGQSQLSVIFNQGTESRFMLFKILGKKNDDDTISYKGFLKPYPANLERFFSYWGMSTDRYQARKKALENAGYIEVWHQSFHDAGEQEVHQAVWQKLIGTGIEKKVAPQNSKLITL
jgi:hypothetical protein